jgi:hypothetical protein
VSVDAAGHREFRGLDDARWIIDFADDRVGIVLRKNRYCAVAKAAAVLEPEIWLVEA